MATAVRFFFVFVLLQQKEEEGDSNIVVVAFFFGFFWKVERDGSCRPFFFFLLQEEEEEEEEGYGNFCFLLFVFLFEHKVRSGFVLLRFHWSKEEEDDSCRRLLRWLCLKKLATCAFLLV